MFVLLMPHAKKDLAKLQPNEREKAIRKLDALEALLQKRWVF